MNQFMQKVCVWSGVLALILLGVAVVSLMKIMPPWSPMESVAEVVAHYQAGGASISLGAFVMILSATFLIPFYAAISVQMQRIEGKASPLASTQLLGGFGISLFLVVPAILFGAAAFRPDRAPELTYLLNDLAWLCFVTPFGPAMIQTLAIGVAILSDKNKVPVFSRWIGYYNIWLSILFIPGGMALLTKTGPFAWNGLLALWLPFGLFGIWFIIMIFAMLKAIKQTSDTQAV
jgi:hypothetical protein